MTENPRVFGADYSVYVRIVRLCLIEKGVEYELLPIDVFAKEGPPQSYLARHPFGRIPAFEHAGFWLYETSAIAWRAASIPCFVRSIASRRTAGSGLVKAPILKAGLE